MGSTSDTRLAEPLFKSIVFVAFSFVVALTLISTHQKVYACTCDPGWYVCGSGTMCCHGGGCPSNICGTCTCGGQHLSPCIGCTGYVWDGTTSVCNCQLTPTSGGGYPCDGNACTGCGADTPPPSGNDPVGWHDGSDCTNSFGWACDADGYSTPLIIQFYDGPKANGVLIGSTVANIAAEPAVAASCGGNANHRFVFTTHNSFKNGVAHDIYAYAVNIGGGSDFKLNGTQKPITCAVLPCPTGFNVSCAPSGSQATVSWNALGSAVGYLLRANKDPQPDWMGPGDFTVEPVNPSVTVNIAPNSNYVYDVQGKASGEVYPYAGDRCPFSTFNCPSLATYTLEITVQEATPGCPPTGGLQDNASVSLYDSGNNFIASGSTLAGGVIDFPGIPTTTTSFNLAATKTVGTDVYDLHCEGSNVVALLAPKSFVNPPANSIQNVKLGIKKNPKQAWSVVLDGDVYAPSITTVIPSSGALGGFTNYLLNYLASLGGIAMSNGAITTNPAMIYKSSYGAYSKSLLSAVPFGDVALSRFQFTPPTHGGVKGLTIPAAGTVLTIPADALVSSAPASSFNTWLTGANPTYTLTAPNTTAILYLTGATDLDFTHGLTASDATKRLIIVAPQKVVIRKAVGSPIASYLASNNPNIMAGIISSGDITFESQGTDPGSDIPIMMTGPLVSKSSMLLNRNLGEYTDNGLYPAQSIKVYLKFLYDISNAEFTNKDILNYTGFRAFDVQFVYDDWNTFP